MKRYRVIGFVFGDSFDDLLRNISEDYLRACRRNLEDVLRKHGIACDDLFWCLAHGGDSSLMEIVGSWQENAFPSDFSGWGSCDLLEKWKSEMSWEQIWKRCKTLDDELQRCQPSLRCTIGDGTRRWDVELENYSSVLRYIAYFWAWDVSDWNAETVAQSGTRVDNIWRQVAFTLCTDDQNLLGVTLEKARLAYTPLGFDILLRGYQSYIESGNHNGKTTRLTQLP